MAWMKGKGWMNGLDWMDVMLTRICKKAWRWWGTLALAFDCQRLSTAFGGFGVYTLDRGAGNDERGTELARA